MVSASIVDPVESAVVGVLIAAVVVALLCTVFDGVRRKRPRRDPRDA